MWYLIHIHFSVPANFVPYVYLDVFLSNSILFWWISVIYFTFCATLVWLFRWQILKAIGNLCIDIWISASISAKIVLVKSSGDFPVKHSFWSLLFNYRCRSSWCGKDHLPWKVHVHFRHAKESCLLSGL